MTTNVEAVAETLARRGIDTLFGLIGNGNLDLVVEMTDKHRARYVSVRHENAAVAAADGFARAGSRIGVATVTHGPGLTNALTALVTAQRASSPLLLITGNASSYTGRSTQRLDHKSVVEALGVPVIQPAATDDWAAAAEHAIALAQNGAVLLDLPAASMRQPAHRQDKVANIKPSCAADLDIVALQAAVQVLAASNRVIIVAGRGAVRAGVRDALIDLSRRTGALLGTSLAAKGLFAGDSHDIGVLGGVATPFAQEACRQCDALVVAGASLNGFTTDHDTLFRSAKIIRLDRDAASRPSLPADITIVGDLKQSAAALRDATQAKNDGAWKPSGPVATAHSSVWSDRVLDEIELLLPKARTMIFDHGDLPNAALTRFSVSDPTQWIFMPDFGSLGLSVAAAVGAATARPDRRAVVIVGDGGLMMSLSDLDTLKRSGAPVLVVCLNNGCYGAEYPHLKALGASLTPATFDSASLADIARGIGLKAASVREGDNLGVLSDFVSDNSGPALLEIHCPPP